MRPDYSDLLALAAAHKSEGGWEVLRKVDSGYPLFAHAMMVLSLWDWQGRAAVEVQTSREAFEDERRFRWAIHGTMDLRGSTELVQFHLEFTYRVDDSLAHDGGRSTLKLWWGGGSSYRDIPPWETSPMFGMEDVDDQVSEMLRSLDTVGIERLN